MEKTLKSIKFPGLDDVYVIPETDISNKADNVQVKSGSIITADNSAHTPLKGLRVFGKTEQFTTTGKNLLSVPRKETNYGGVSYVYENGKIVLSGTATTTVTIWISGNYDNTTPIMTLPAGTYTFTNCIAYNYDGTTRTSYTGTKTFDTPLEITGVLYEQYTSGTTTNKTAYLQIEKGSVATSWEPYTGGMPSPNPDYPQTLESVGDGGSVTVTVAGKNLFDVPHLAVNGTGNRIDNGSPSIVDGVLRIARANVTGKVPKFFVNLGTAVPFLGKTLYLKAKAKASTSVAKFGFGIGFYKETTNSIKNAAYSRFPSSTTEQELSCIFNVPSTLDESNPNLGIVVYADNAASITTQAVGDYVDYWDIMVSFDDVKYEPYKELQTMIHQTPNGLPGIHVSEGGNYTDENGWQWICDEVDFGRGKYVQRIGTKYLNGTENWVDRGSSKTARWLLGWNIGFEKYSGGIPRLLCDKYLPIDTNEDWNRYNTLLSFGAVGGSLVIQNQSITSLEAFKATLAADPIVLQGVLATPIETALSAEQLAAYAALHTYTPNTTIYNDGGADMEVKYYTPNTAVQMVHSPTDEGKVLAIDKHGCVVLSDSVGSGTIDIDLTGSNAGEITPVNADTLGGIPASEYVTVTSVNQQVRKAVPRNLLDNSDFTNPVNQRGKTTYNSAGYIIDRWRSNASNLEINVVSGGIKIQNNATTGRTYIQQVINRPDLIGKRLTYVVEMADGSKVFGCATMNTTVGQNTVVNWITTNNSYIGFYNSNGYPAVWICVKAGESYTIKNVALYEGEYTAETLPEYQPKGYNVELVECQRYFLTNIGPHIIGHSGTTTSKEFWINIPILIPMRITPTVTIDIADNVIFGTTSGYLVSAVNSIKGVEMRNNSIIIILNIETEAPQHYATGALYLTSLTISAEI